jgi:translation initiation factor 2 subunit 1
MSETEHNSNNEVVHREPSASGAIANCRMYENKYPEVDDLVMVEVKSIEEMGAYVHLKEYNDIEGMILLSELSRRRIRSINKIIRAGRQEVVAVLRVDKEKGYIDLSKKRVSDEERQRCEDRYNKSKAVHSIMRHVAESLHRDMESIYIQFAWPMYKKYGHAYDAFKLALTEPDTLFAEIPVDPEIRDVLVSNIKRRLAPQPMKIRADVEVTCFHYDGIDAIKEALKKGEETSTEDCPVKVRLVAPPLYVVVTTSLVKEVGIKALNIAVEAIAEKIKQSKGELIVKVAPRTVLERDEKEFATMLEKLEKQNTDVPGDDDGSDAEGSEEEED